MNTKDQNDFKLLFENMREQLVAKATLSDGNLSALNTGDLVDQTASERDVQVLLKLQGRDRFLMMKIEHAIEKIENNTFGQCEECDGDISMKRLLARPVATQCICCKEEQEMEEQQIVYQKRSKTNGQIIKNSGHNVINFPGDNGAIRESSHTLNLKNWQDKYEAGNILTKSM